MEPLRGVSRQDSGKSEARRQTNRSNAAIQHVTDTMIAVTESFRYHYQQQHGSYSPAAPAPTYTNLNSYYHPRSYAHSNNCSNSNSNSNSNSHSHARSPSSVSEVSQALLDMDIVSQMTVSDVSPVSPPRNNYMSTILMSGRQPNTETDSLLDRELEPEMNETSARMPEDLIRLATPNLPPRLDTPHTPSHRFSVPITLAGPKSDAPPASNAGLLPADFSVNRSGLVQATRGFEAFRSTTQHHQYMVLRPDMGTRELPLGTVTHIRAGSDPYPASSATQGLRRKPLNEGARHIVFNHPCNESLFVAVICMAQLLIYASLAQTLTSARRIGESFFEPERTTHLVWFTSAYMLSYAATILLGNRIGNICGQRQAFVAGYFWFALWSLFTGLSVYVHSSGGAVFFCIGRAMQGIGPALIIPNGYGLLLRAYPPGPRKMVAMGLFDASAPCGFVVGSVMTGLFAKYASWPWAFYCLAAVCTALGISSVLVVPTKRVLVHNFEGNLWKRLDVFASVTGISALVLFSVGWNQIPLVGWDTPEAYILIFTGLLLIPLFNYFESQASHPLVPFKQIHLTAGITLGFVAAASAAFGIWVWYFAQFIEVLRGWGPLLTSAGLVPILVIGVVVGFACWPFANRDFTAQLAMVSSSIAILISSTLMATAPAKQEYWANSFVSAIFMGVGMVLIIPSASTVLGRDVPEGQLGLATSLANMAAAFSFSVGLGMAGAVEMGKKNNKNPLGGYRNAQYFGLGLGGLAFILALGLLGTALLRRRRD